MQAQPHPIHCWVYCTSSLPLFLWRVRGISPHPLLHLGRRRKRSFPLQSHAWAQRKSSRVGQKEGQSIGMHQLQITPINLKVERFWGRKSTHLWGKVGEPRTTLVPERQWAHGFAATTSPGAEWDLVFSSSLSKLHCLAQTGMAEGKPPPWEIAVQKSSCLSPSLKGGDGRLLMTSTPTP